MKNNLILIIMGFFSFLNCKTKNTENSSSKEHFYNLKYFGEINLNKTKDYDGIVNFDNNSIAIDLNIEENSIHIDQLKNTNHLLENLEFYINKAYKKITTDIENEDSSVKDYYDHHKDELVDILNDKNEFFKILKIKRIGFYIDEDSDYSVFDFTIGSKVTDYIISVQFDGDLTIESLDMIS